MERLELDFNRRDAEERIRIGPAALEQNAALREGRIRPGELVLVIDDDGNRCVGVLREVPGSPPGHQFRVELDWGTWKDGEEAAPPATRAFASV